MPVTYLRAAAVIGSGSESFRTVFYLVKRLPVMVTPRWVDHRDPADRDRRRDRLSGAGRRRARAAGGRSIEIGGPDVTTYGGMMDALAEAMGTRTRPRIPVPLLTPYLSSLWIGLVTPVDAEVAKPLIEGARDRDGGQGPLRDGAVRGRARRRSTKAMRAALAEGGRPDG